MKITNKKITGIIVADNSDCIGYKNKICIKIPQYVNDVKKLIKNNWVLVGGNSYEEIIKTYAPNNGKLLVITKKEIENVATFKSVEDALKFIEDNDSSNKTEIFVLGGKQIYEYCYKKNLYDEFLKIRIDVDICGDCYLDFKTIEWQKIKFGDIRYQAGFQFWYERYNPKKKSDGADNNKDMENVLNEIYMKEAAKDMFEENL